MKILCILGTRPEVIKLAPVIRLLKAESSFEVRVLSSGQHRELLVPLLEWFEISVDEDMSVMTENQTLPALTSKLVADFSHRFAAWTPDLILGQGDTTTVFCAALCAFYANIKFGHVEAGLRTRERRNPFPEEFNRVAVAHLAALHFCPTQRSRSNLLAEGVDRATTYLTGNTVIDALLYTKEKIQKLPPRKFQHNILLTSHRRENFGLPMENIFNAVLDLCRDDSSINVLYPVHPNPNVKNVAQRMLGGHPQITLSSPLDYPDLVAAMQHAKLILTDSGGIQEEAPALGKPVLVLRESTERPEAVELGVAEIVGTDRAAIVRQTRRLLDDDVHYEKMARGGSPYGDGHSAEAILNVIQGL